MTSSLSLLTVAISAATVAVLIVLAVFIVVRRKRLLSTPYALLLSTYCVVIRAAVVG